MLSVHFEDSFFSAFDFCLQPFLYRLLPFFNYKISSFIINNDNVTALFLAKYFAIKFSTGHTFRDIINPVVKDLKRVVLRNIYLPHLKLKVDISKMSNFLSYRSFIFKKLLFKNALLYKNLNIKFLFFNGSFFNFYILLYFRFFFF
jgi:hypothetical protein